MDQPLEPEPDIVVDAAQGKIGIELTDLHPSGEVKRRDEAEQIQIAAAAQQLYMDAGHAPVHVQITWADVEVRWKQRRGELAHVLSGIVAQHPRKGSSIREVGNGFEPLQPGVPIVHLSLSGADSHETSEWREGSFHMVGFCGIVELQERIAFEDVKALRYREAYASRWLVLVVGAHGPSTWGIVQDNVPGTRFRSRYDRVFVFEHDRHRCHELQVEPV